MKRFILHDKTNENDSTQHEEKIIKNSHRFERTAKNRGRKLKNKKETESTSLNKQNENQRHQYKFTVREILMQGKRLHIHEETCFLAMVYLEEFLSSDHGLYLPQNVQKTISHPQLLASVLLLISSKLNDVMPPSIEEFSQPFGEPFRQNLILAEKMVLEKIDFVYIEESPFILFHNQFSNSKKEILLCCELFQRSMLEEWAMLYGWELISKAVMMTIKPIPLKEENLECRLRIKDLSAKIKKFVAI